MDERESTSKWKRKRKTKITLITFVFCCIRINTLQVKYFNNFSKQIFCAIYVFFLNIKSHTVDKLIVYCSERLKTFCKPGSVTMRLH